MANWRGAVEIINHSFFLQKCINRDKSSENPELYSRSGASHETADPDRVAAQKTHFIVFATYFPLCLFF